MSDAHGELIAVDGSESGLAFAPESPIHLRAAPLAGASAPINSSAPCTQGSVIALAQKK